MGENGETKTDLAELREQHEATLLRLESQQMELELRLLAEATTSYSGKWIDPDDALKGDKGELWTRIGGETGDLQSSIITTEPALTEARSTCRALAIVNEYAINGHENRINYIVGAGHQYKVLAKQGAEVPEDGLVAAQAAIDRFVKDNAWHERQQEIVRRKDRDGECFLRFFHQADGRILVRFVEPGQVATPGSQSNNPAVKFGIETEPDDVETVVAYWIDEKRTAPTEIQHRKANVDANVRRGLPLFYPVRKLLQKIETIQNNMSLLAGIQSAIAMIRRHSGPRALKTAIESRVQGDADVSITDTHYGTTTYHQRYPGGRVLDVPKDVEYDFPAQRAKPDAFVPVCAQLIRAVASRLVMPEFMLSSDASNANYSSTMVAEGPAVKMFERLQHGMVQEDQEVMDRVLDAAVAAGALDGTVRENVEVAVTLPMLTTRDRLKEAQADEILVRNEAMSTATMAERHGLDYDAEKGRMDEARKDADLYGGDADFGEPAGSEEPEFAGAGGEE